MARAAGKGSTEWEKVKVQGREERRKQCSWEPDRTPSRGEGGAGRPAGGGGGEAQLGPPGAPLAASGVGSSGLPPLPAHCSFAGRRGNCLLIAEVRGRGAGRGRAGQNGSVGRAARCLPPPPLASAARPGRQPQQQQRPRQPSLAASPEGSAPCPRGALSARNKWPPHGRRGRRAPQPLGGARGRGTGRRPRC